MSDWRKIKKREKKLRLVIANSVGISKVNKNTRPVHVRCAVAREKAA